MSSVKQILDTKGRDIWSVDPENSVYDAIKLMADKGVGCLLVMDGEKLLGIVTERDYARKVILENKSSKKTPVKDLMTVDVICVGPTQNVQECMALMTNGRMRHLPVVDGERVEGLISIGDLVKAIIAEQQFEIEQLQHYINS